MSSHDISEAMDMMREEHSSIAELVVMRICTASPAFMWNASG